VRAMYGLYVTVKTTAKQNSEATIIATVAATFSDLVSRCVVPEDLFDKRQLFLDVLRGLLSVSSHIVCIRSAVIARSPVRHWLGYEMSVAVFRRIHIRAPQTVSYRLTVAYECHCRETQLSFIFCCACS